MKSFALFLILALFLTLVSSLAADPDITELESIPDKPYEDDSFEIHVEADDSDGIDRIKLYVDDDYEDTEYCHGDLVCEVYFEVEENKPGYYEYKVKVYDEEGDMESDSIRVYVRDEDDDGILIRSFYATPNNPYVGTTFTIYVDAEYESDLDKIKFYANGKLEETERCNDEDCEESFDVVENSPGYHSYKVKVYAEDDETETETITIFVREYYNTGYCGDGLCNNGETASSCRNDCSSACTAEGQRYSIHPGSLSCCPGLSAISCASPDVGGNCQSCVGASVCTQCGNGICGAGENKCNCPSDCQFNPLPRPPQPTNYCGNGICAGSESCSVCPQDCGSCAGYCGDRICKDGESCSTCQSDCGSCGNVLPIIYTCEQRGGECCDNGGKGAVSGSYDCPSTCFSSCNPKPSEGSGSGTSTGGTPTGGVIVVDSTVLLLVGLVIVMVFLLFLAARLS